MLLFLSISFASLLYQIRMPHANALNHTLKLFLQDIILKKTNKQIPSKEKRKKKNILHIQIRNLIYNQLEPSLFESSSTTKHIKATNYPYWKYFVHFWNIKILSALQRTSVCVCVFCWLARTTNTLMTLDMFVEWRIKKSI